VFYSTIINFDELSYSIMCWTIEGLIGFSFERYEINDTLLKSLHIEC
jgi:hypothetical protein